MERPPTSPTPEDSEEDLSVADLEKEARDLLVMMEEIENRLKVLGPELAAHDRDTSEMNQVAVEFEYELHKEFFGKEKLLGTLRAKYQTIQDMIDARNGGNRTVH